MEQGLEHIFDENTCVIIMGTFPSIQSRGECYYNHPQNQFWKIMAEICHNEKVINGNRDVRYRCLLSKGVGLWDVIQSCAFERKSSLDSKIIKSSIVYNDFSLLRTKCPNLKCIVFSSGNACKLYKRYLRQDVPEEMRSWLNVMTNNGQNVLPSTSPANARQRPEEKLKEWKDFFQSIL